MDRSRINRSDDEVFALMRQVLIQAANRRHRAAPYDTQRRGEREVGKNKISSFDSWNFNLLILVIVSNFFSRFFCFFNFLFSFWKVLAWSRIVFLLIGTHLPVVVSVLILKVPTCRVPQTLRVYVVPIRFQALWKTHLYEWTQQAVTWYRSAVYAWWEVIFYLLFLIFF